MHWKLKDQQLKTSTYIDAVPKPYGKCKAKSTIATHIKKENAIQAQHKGQLSNHKRRGGKKEGKKKTYGNKPKTIKKTATVTYTLIITLNVNRLKFLTKRHKLTIDNENQIHIYAVYKRLTLDLGTHTD